MNEKDILSLKTKDVLLEVDVTEVDATGFIKYVVNMMVVNGYIQTSIYNALKDNIDELDEIFEIIKNKGE